MMAVCQEEMDDASAARAAVAVAVAEPELPATLRIPSPEAPTTVGTADAGGTVLAASVAKFVDSVAASVAESDSAALPMSQIRADAEALRRDFEGTLERFRKEDEELAAAAAAAEES
jgi:hypothetical protein